MKLIARRGKTTFLLQDGGSGVVVDVEDKIQYEPRPIASILKQGYWTAEKGSQEFVDALLSIPKPGSQAAKPKPKPQAKSILQHSRELLLATAKSASDGVWRTIEGDQKVFIQDGKVYAGGPGGSVVGGREPEKKPKPKQVKPKPADKPKPKPVAKPKPKPTKQSDSEQPKKPKQGIVDGSGKPPVGPPWEEIEKAIDAAESKAKGWAKSLTKSEADAVSNWSDTSYGAMRKEIGSGKPSKQASEFLAALEKAPPIEAEVYRGMYFEEDKLERFKQLMNTIGVGATWRDSAPFSTSLDPMIAAGFMGGYRSGVMMKIKTKTGRYITPASVAEEESEVVSMPRVKYKITAIETGRQVNINVNLGGAVEPKLYIEMEEIE